MKSQKKHKSSSKKIYGSSIHTSIHGRPNSSSTFARKTILTVIILAFITVGTATFCALFLTNEHIVKSQISSIASGYYENFLYSSFANSKELKNVDINQAMQKYNDNGLAPITLRQLLLYDPTAIDDSVANNILKYCNENSTIITFYPNPPYERTSYHTEITYSCDF